AAAPGGGRKGETGRPGAAAAGRGPPPRTPPPPREPRPGGGEGAPVDPPPTRAPPLLPERDGAWQRSRAVGGRRAEPLSHASREPPPRYRAIVCQARQLRAEARATRRGAGGRARGLSGGSLLTPLRRPGARRK